MNVRMLYSRYVGSAVYILVIACGPELAGGARKLGACGKLLIRPTPQRETYNIVELSG